MKAETEPKLCGRCGERPAVRHYGRCASCRSEAERARYAAKREEIAAQRKERYRAWHAARRCVGCGAVLDAGETRVYCAGCRAVQVTVKDRFHRKKRRGQAGRFGVGEKPLHVGGNVRVVNVRYVRVGLDAEAFACAETLLYRERVRRDAQRDAEGITDEGERLRRRSLLFQASRLMRYVTRCYWRDYSVLSHRARARSGAGSFVWISGLGWTRTRGRLSSGLHRSGTAIFRARCGI